MCVVGFLSFVFLLMANFCDFTQQDRFDLHAVVHVIIIYQTSAFYGPGRKTLHAQIIENEQWALRKRAVHE